MSASAWGLAFFFPEAIALLFTRSCAGGEKSCKRVTTCNLEAVSEQLLGHLTVVLNAFWFLDFSCFLFPHKYTLTFREGGWRTPSHPITVNKGFWLIPPSAYEFCINTVTQVHTGRSMFVLHNLFASWLYYSKFWINEYISFIFLWIWTTRSDRSWKW